MESYLAPFLQVLPLCSQVVNIEWLNNISSSEMVFTSCEVNRTHFNGCKRRNIFTSSYERSIIGAQNGTNDVTSMERVPCSLIGCP